MPRCALPDLNLYYEMRGEGPPILFFSGTGWSGAHWNLSTVPYFARRFRTIVHDYRGVGRTDRPPGPYSTRQFAEDGLRLLDALGILEPVHVVGHSMGGRVAQWLALDHPERVRSLVLVASGPGPLPGIAWTAGVPAAVVAELVALGWPGYMEAHVRDRFMFLNPDPDLVERFAATHRGQLGTDLLSYCWHVQARQGHDTTALLGRIAVPTLVIVGEADTVAGSTLSHVESSRYLADHIPGAEWALIPDAAHMVFLEQAEAFNRRVEAFLDVH